MVLTDLLAGLRLAGRVDLLVFNPPYVPSPPEEARPRGAEGVAQCAHPLLTGWRRPVVSRLGGRRPRAGGDRPPAPPGAPQLALPCVRVSHALSAAQVPALLSELGALYLVAVSDNDVPDLLRLLQQLGLSARVALVRTADEERLHVVVARRQRPPDTVLS